MPNKMIPNPDPRGDAPLIGGDRPDPIGSVRMGPNSVNPPAPGKQQQQQQEQQPMGEGEKYWFDKAQVLLAENAKLQPLGQYADVIAYLDNNQDAVNLVLGHMKGETSQGTNNDFVNDFDRDLGRTEQLPNGGEFTAPKLEQPRQPNMSEIHTQLRQQYDSLLREKGIPEHEKDRFVQFLMNPGELSPEEVFGMFSHVNQLRKGPEANNQNPQGSGSGVPMNSPEVPPMSVAGINGGSEDPLLEAEASAVAKSRIMVDPNNL